ncbi:TPA: hypothetical protein LSH88_004860 [Serratia marcescens]|nr:hypothetical protein [Serratia marcescens]
MQNHTVFHHFLQKSPESWILADSAHRKAYKLFSPFPTSPENITTPHGEGKQTHYVHGANIAGFVKVAEAMLAQGVL